MKFDFCIGNPPYQDQTLGDNKGFAPPVYDKFLDAAVEIADKVEMIHPARFLFNAGSTPKAWNEKMLNDAHFKILHFEQNSKNIFSNTNIMGGIVISYRDNNSQFEPIKMFSSFAELNSIFHKVVVDAFIGLNSIMTTSYAYHFTQTLHEEHPEILKTTIIAKGKSVPLLSKGHEYDLKSNVIEKLPFVFLEAIPNDGKDYVAIHGRSNNQRVVRYIRRDYVNTVINLDKYKVFIPRGHGDLSLGSIGTPIVCGPGAGYTETFLSIGAFDSQQEAENAKKYILCKFSRALFGLLKVTQLATPDTWKYVPLQDFTSTSDINWDINIAGIDQQLYKKYGLSKEEIDFIETHVKEME